MVQHWDLITIVSAAVYNSNLVKGKPMDPEKMNPYRKRLRNRQPTAPITVLKQLLPGGNGHGG